MSKRVVAYYNYCLHNNVSLYRAPGPSASKATDTRTRGRTTVLGSLRETRARSVRSMRKGCFGIILLILLSTGYCAHKAGMNDSMWSATVGNTLGFPATEASQSIPSTFADSLGRHPRSKALLVMSDGTLSQSQKKVNHA